MTIEIPITRATMNEKNGFVVSKCPKTERPVFTHIKSGCINCESHVNSTEELLTCSFGEKESARQALENARNILRNLKEAQEKDI